MVGSNQKDTSQPLPAYTRKHPCVHMEGQWGRGGGEERGRERDRATNHRAVV